MGMGLRDWVLGFLRQPCCAAQALCLCLHFFVCIVCVEVQGCTHHSTHMEVRGQLSGVESVLALFTWIRGKTQGPQTILSHLPVPHKLGHIFCLHMLCLITGLGISLSPFDFFSVFFWVCVGEISLYMCEWWLMPVIAHVLTSEDILGYWCFPFALFETMFTILCLPGMLPLQSPGTLPSYRRAGITHVTVSDFLWVLRPSACMARDLQSPQTLMSVLLFHFTSFIELTLSLGFAVFIIALVYRIHLTQCKIRLPLSVGFPSCLTNKQKQEKKHTFQCSPHFWLSLFFSAWLSFSFPWNTLSNIPFRLRVCWRVIFLPTF